MSPRLLLIPLLASSLAGFTPSFAIAGDAPPAIASDKPWKETFAMTLRGKERTYAQYLGNSFLIATPEDLADATFLDQKDVVINAKLGRVDGMNVRFYNLPKVEANGPLELWRTRIDGDNLWAFGRITAGTPTRFAVVAVEAAPSDAQIIAERTANIRADDWNGRLAAAAWAKDLASKQGNREFWLVAADNLISQAVDDAAAQGEQAKDVALVLKAMSWCQDLLRDIPRAARIGSAPWIRQAGGAGAEEVAKRMRRWDLEFYSGQWRPRGEALGQEFTDRFTAIGWRDAEGYYKLGRWADANAEVLPRARELSYRSYQAGFRANPNHNGVRRELGMEPTSEGAGGAQALTDFKDGTSGVVVPAPTGWSRTDPIDGDVTWIDPGSDTAYITVRVIRTQDAGGDFKSLWASQLISAQSKNSFANLSDEAMAYSQGEARRLRYTYREGRYRRVAELIVVKHNASKATVRFDASAAESEQEAVSKQLAATFAKMTVGAVTSKPPVTEPAPGAKPPADHPAKPGTAKPGDAGKPAAPAAPGAGQKAPDLKPGQPIINND